MSPASAPGRPSWLQRVRRRMLASFEQNTHTSNPANPNLTSQSQSLVQFPPLNHQDSNRTTNTGVPLPARLIQMSRRPSAPIHPDRPNTAPTVANHTLLRPIRWEFGHAALSLVSPSESRRTERCPYDPEALHFFGSFEATDTICGLSPRRIWQGNRHVATPCQDCLEGTERAHINVSPSRFSRRRSIPQQRASLARRHNNATSRPIQNNTPDYRDGRPRTAYVPGGSWRRPIGSPSTRNTQPSRFDQTTESDSQATYERLRAIVEHGRTFPPRPPSSAPRLHRLSPDIAFIHRSEVAAHQAAIREGRHSPVLEFQARGPRNIDVIGYRLSQNVRDTSATVLYPEHILPGEYIPPPPQPLPSPTRVLSPFRRRPIDLSPVPRPTWVSRLHEPPFVPALPEGTTLRPFSEWGRPISAPEPEWEGVLRHSALYRTRGLDHSPRTPSPLRQQHRPGSFESDWSHGTMPFEDEEDDDDERRGGKKRLVNGVGKRARIRGGGEDCSDNESLLKGGTEMQCWGAWTGCRVVEGKEGHDVPLSYSVYKMDFRRGQRLDGCMEPSSQMPRLRGGGGGRSDRSPTRVPGSLLYLAGSRGRKPGQSVTVTEWNRMKPKKRMGGFLGMAVYGSKAGQPYIPRTRNQEVQADLEPCTLTTIDLDVGVGKPLASPAGSPSPAPSPVPTIKSSRDANTDAAADSTPKDSHDPLKQGADDAAQGQASSTDTKTAAPKASPESTADNGGSNAANSAPRDDPSNDAPPYPTTPPDDGDSGAGNGAASGGNVPMPPAPEKST